LSLNIGTDRFQFIQLLKTPDKHDTNMARTLFTYVVIVSDLRLTNSICHSEMFLVFYSNNSQATLIENVYIFESKLRSRYGLDVCDLCSHHDAAVLVHMVKSLTLNS